MRLDPHHVDKIKSAMTEDGIVKIDIGFMAAAMGRLSPWECGLLASALAKAASNKRRTPEQRVLLALFVHSDPEGGTHV